MGSMIVPVQEYTITIEGFYSKDRIPCLDALLGTMLEIETSDHSVIEPIVESVVESVVETPVTEASIIA